MTLVLQYRGALEFLTDAYGYDTILAVYASRLKNPVRLGFDRIIN